MRTNKKKTHLIVYVLADREMMYEKYSPNVKTFEVVGRKNSDSFERHR